MNATQRDKAHRSLFKVLAKQNPQHGRELRENIRRDCALGFTRSGFYYWIIEFVDAGFVTVSERSEIVDGVSTVQQFYSLTQKGWLEAHSLHGPKSERNLKDGTNSKTIQ